MSTGKDISVAEVTLRSEEAHLHTRVVSSEHQCWDEDPPQHLAVKIRCNFIHQSETEGFWTPRGSLKGPIHKLTLLKKLILGTSGRTVARVAPET